MLRNRYCLALLVVLMVLTAFYSDASAQGGKNWSDSLFTMATAERSLQFLLDSLGYDIDVANDELGLEIFRGCDGVNTATLVIEVAGSAVSAQSGYYEAGDTSAFYQLFGPYDGPGSTTQFTFTSFDWIGFYMKPNLSGEDYRWLSEESFNVDAYDHAWVFSTGVANQYLICWEDLPDGGDGDYQDLVIKVTFDDDLAPEFDQTCPADVAVECDAVPTAPTLTATDNCDPNPVVTFNETTTAGACDHEYTLTRTWTATDESGNSVQCVQTITVEDNTAPVLSGCPGDITIDCDETVPAAATVTATDNCDPGPVVSFNETTTAGACDQEYTITRTWTATDDCGNSSQCVQVITVEDNTAPVLTGCPADITVECDAVPTAATVTATDNCDPSPVVSFNETTIAGTCDHEYTLTRTWTATDDCGNSSQCVQVITVEDNTAPVLTGCPADVTVECDAVPMAATVTATDNCDSSPVVSFNETTTAGACDHEYTLTRIWTATDDCGNSSQCVQVITVEDNTAPVLTGCPADVTIECDETVPAAATVTATDNCDPSPVVSFNETTTAGACNQEYTITRTWTATDDCGNSSQCVQVITVEDNTAPVLSGCPTNVTVECDDIPVPANVTATDNCDPSPVVSFNETTTTGACDQEYTITRTWTATDDCGNSSQCVQVITVEDNTAPVLTGCPADVTVECDAVPTEATVTATDNCDPSPVVSFNETTTAGACDHEYTLTRTWTATDDCGNSSQCVQVITVEDNTAPQITCPGDISVECLSDVPAADIGDVTATDNCDPGPVITHIGDNQSGTTCPIIITRTYRATDDCGNYAECTQTITVDDQTPPVLVGCPANVTIECDGTIPSVVSVTATDNCDTSPTVTFNETTTAGACDQEYTVTRTWTATDYCGNSSQCVQVITVEDNTVPQITCPGPIAVQCLSDVPAPDISLVTATDNCDPNPVKTFVSDQQSGATQPITITRTYRATDDCGNYNECTQTITVNDNTAPVLSGCPADITIECDETVPSPANVTATDNCDPDPIVTLNETTTAGACGQEYTITRTWTATDDVGNSSQCVQVITVEDNTAPVLAGCPADVTVECDAIPAPATVTATDNCDPSPVVTMDETTTAGSCDHEYTLTRTWTATDDCGNSSQCVQVITVEDNTAPQITCPAPVSVECLVDVPAPDIGAVTATDNCDPSPVITHVGDNQSGTTCPIIITRTYRATDDCGNYAECTQTITVDDQTPPVLVGCPTDVAIECDETIPSPASVTATDNCDPDPDVSFDETTTAGGCDQEYTITRTWTATDDCGNTSQCVQVITVEDNTAPQIACPGPIEVQCFNDVPAPDVSLVTAIDNCDPSPVKSFVSDQQGATTQPLIITRTYGATDNCGNYNECTQIITVNDDTAPVLSGCPADITINCDDPVPDPAEVTATDNCDPFLTVSMEETGAAGSCPQEKTITRTWTATDNVGNSSQCVQVITVEDNTAPQFDQACPGDITVECHEIPTAPAMTATDNCDPDPNVNFYETTTTPTCPPPCPYPYDINRTWVAMDACGNSTTCNQIITVTDNTAPELVDCPADITIECDEQIPAPADVTAADNCDPAPVVTYDEVETAGSCSYEKTITRTWTAADWCGNSSQCIQVITVADNTAPVCSVPDDITITLCNLVEVCLPVGCTDNCDPDPALSVASGPGQIVNGEWCYTPVSYTESFTVTIHCEDACGNNCEDDFVVTFDVNQPPVATCPGDVTLVVCDLSEICIPGFSCDDPDGNLASCTVNIGTLQSGEVCFTPVEGDNVIELTATDDCDVSDACQTTVTVVINSPPVCGTIDDVDVFMWEPEELCIEIPVTGPDDNLDYCHVIDGPGEVNSPNWCYTPFNGTDESFDVTIECVDVCGETCQQTFHVDIDLNHPPVIECPDYAVIHWGSYFNATATATDPNEGQTITFSLGADSPGDIDQNTGEYSLFADGSLICDNEIMVIATDNGGESDTCTFNICVQNTPPTITCSEPLMLCMGETASGTVEGKDQDHGPSPLMYSIASFDGPGTVNVNPATGAFSWSTEVLPEYAGTFELCIQVSDNAPTCELCSPDNADTCCLNITVVPAYNLYIEKRHKVIQGQIEPVKIYLDVEFPIYEMGGFDFLIQYDASALSFLGADPGQLLVDCGWEYFTYRFGANGNCGQGACPSGVLRLVTIAEINNGDNHPGCYTSDETGDLADLDFLVTNDRTFECQYVPIRFYWYDCGDNAFSTVTGDTLIISRYVYDYANPLPINDLNHEFPTWLGANYLCDTALEDGKPDPLRCADFWNGGIDIVCADSIDDRGDINLNEIPYEVGDAVLFAQYFVYGMDVFNINPDGQIAASDVNADGLTLTVADLVYIIRVVVGDALPYSKVTPIPVNFTVNDGIFSVEDEEMGAAFVVIDGNVKPVLLADNMEMEYSFNGQNTRVLVYSMNHGESFSGDFLMSEGRVLSIEMATYDGTPVIAKLLPDEFVLYQSYPNPFNPSTTISFNLPVASEYNLTIYNVTGQQMEVFTGYAETGITTIEWHASDYQASGVYFYKLTAGNYTDTKKMILLK